MNAIRGDMEGALDAMISDQKAAPGECKVTLVQFDDQIEVVFKDLPVQDVPPIKLMPRGTTALWDAISTGLAVSEAVEAELKIVVIITDGYNNASRECDLATIRERIQKAEEGAWKFVFLGASGLDAMQGTADLGVKRSAGNAVSFGASGQSVRAAVKGFSKVVCQSRTRGPMLGDEGVAFAYTQSHYEDALKDEENATAVTSTTGTDTGSVSTTVGPMTITKRRR